MKKIISLLVFFFCLFAASYSQNTDNQNSDKVLARITIEDPSDINKLHDLCIEFVHREVREFADVIITCDVLDQLTEQGYKIEILDFASRNLKIDPEYHTYDELLSTINDFAASYPDITKLDTLGISQEMGLYILSLKISDNPDIKEDEPSVLYDGMHHAREPVGMEACLVIIDYLLSNYLIDPQVTEWVNTTEIFFIPMLNPDGWTYIVDNSLNDPWWRKNLRDNNSNGSFDPSDDGVDLNRNYELNWNNGPSNTNSWNYRGPSPFSESETQAKRDLAFEQKFVMSLTYHSYGEVIFYPLHSTGTPIPDQLLFDILAEELGSRIPKFSGTGTYAPFGGICDEGFSDCWMYNEHGTFEFTVETAYMFIPPGDDALVIANDNLQGALYLLDRIKGPGLTGLITDALTTQPLEATVKILEIDNDLLPPRASNPDFGRYTRLLIPGQYTVEVSKEGYHTKTVSNVIVSDGNITELNVELHSIVSIGENPGLADNEFSVYPASPNPFTKSTKIEYSTSEGDNIICELFDISGRRICQLLNHYKPAGKHEILIDNNRLNAGIYFCTIQSSYGNHIQKIIKLD